MEKELTRLWYEFLKRSDSYRDFIKTIRPITKAMRNPAHCANLWGDSGKDPVLNGHLLNLWRFGDVFKVPFEKWYVRERKPWAAVETKTYLAWFDRQIELNDEAYCKSLGLPYLPGRGLMATVETKSVYEHPGGLRRIIETPGLPVLNISVNIYARDEEIRDAVSAIVRQYKKKKTPSLEKLKAYLETYDLDRKEMTKLEIANKILTEYDRNDEPLADKEKIDRISLYHKKALAIIRNVEKGNMHFTEKI